MRTCVCGSTSIAPAMCRTLAEGRRAEVKRRPSNPLTRIASTPAAFNQMKRPPLGGFFICDAGVDEKPNEKVRAWLRNIFVENFYISIE